MIVNARIVAIPDFASRLEALGFQVDGMSPEGLAHRYRRGDGSIDVLAPDGLGSRANLTTSRPGRTLQVPGGPQALQRVEHVDVRYHDRTGIVPRPSLLGAIIGKSCAVDVDDAPATRNSTSHSSCPSSTIPSSFERTSQPRTDNASSSSVG